MFTIRSLRLICLRWPLRSDGTVWIATEGGLTRFRPNAQPPEEMWVTYTPANSPLVRPEILSLAVDSQDNLLDFERKAVFNMVSGNCSN